MSDVVHKLYTNVKDGAEAVYKLAAIKKSFREEIQKVRSLFPMDKEVFLDIFPTIVLTPDSDKLYGKFVLSRIIFPKDEKIPFFYIESAKGQDSIFRKMSIDELKLSDHVQINNAILRILSNAPYNQELAIFHIGEMKKSMTLK